MDRISWGLGKFSDKEVQVLAIESERTPEVQVYENCKGTRINHGWSTDITR